MRHPYPKILDRSSANQSTLFQRIPKMEKLKTLRFGKEYAISFRSMMYKQAVTRTKKLDICTEQLFEPILGNSEKQ